MATTYIIQPGRVFQRMEISPEGTQTSGDSSIPITTVAANLKTTINTTAPFIGVLDEQNHLWRLQNTDVVYGTSSITLNLTDIYRSRRMISHEAFIFATLPDKPLWAFGRYPTADSKYGYAWWTGGGDMAIIYTDTQSPTVGVTPFYTDPKLTTSPGVITNMGNPTTSPYPGGWKALVAATAGGAGGDSDLDFTVVSQPV